MNHQTILQMARAARGYRVSDACWRISMKTQQMVADFPADGVCFSMCPGNVVGSDTQVAFIESVRLQWTCLVAFGAPVFAGRGLTLSAGFNSPASAGGTQLVKPANKMQAIGAASMFQQNIGGDVWISDTGPLTGPVIKANNVFANLSLSGLGNAGDTIDRTFVFDDPIAVSNQNASYAINTDLLIYAPQQFDATGTWELIVEVDICQLPGTLVLPP